MIKNFMYFTVLTFFVILVWISLTIYRNFNPPIPISGIVINPIEGTFNFETVARLRNRQVIPVDFSQTFISTPSPDLDRERETATRSSTFTLPILTPAATPATIIATQSAN